MTAIFSAKRKEIIVHDIYAREPGRAITMQHASSDFPRSQQEYEQPQKGHRVFGYQGHIDAGEKILPPVREKRRVHRLGLRLIIALISLLVLVLICAVIMLTSSSQFPDLTNLHLVFAWFSVSSINVIVNLLLDRMPGKPTHKGITSRLVFATITGLLTPVFIWMMIQGANGPDGVLLVLLITINLNIISYLTLCKKRQISSKS
jgi:hypothetical protein